MELYDKTDNTNKDEQLNPVAVAVGLTLGVITVAMLEALFVWAVLFYLVGLSLTWLQVFGIMLIINGIASKFKSFS